MNFYIGGIHMSKKTRIILVLTCLISVILGCVSLYTPQSKTAEEQGFSAIEAKKHIKEIAQEPHSIYDIEALAQVRDYIIQELAALGLSPEVFHYPNVVDRNGKVVDINNIYAKIDGKQGENGQYILLASHYDSSPKKREGEEEGSLGAADAGYGVSTILEILRVIKENNLPLENGIKILITDGEEMGLLGAKEEMNNNFSIYENVSFVVNIEARGVKGPALMFETSDNNKQVIKMYQKAGLPVSYSLAADIYSKMPNGSDFTEFKKKGLQGVNFAVLNSLDYYHTPRDNYDNVSDTSLQHYGEQILPMVEEFVYTERYGEEGYFESTESSIFFTLLPNVFISYSVTAGYILMGLAAIGLIALTCMYQQKVKKVAKWTGIWSGTALLTLVAGVGISYVISLVSGVTFKLTYMPKVPAADWIVLIISIVATVLIAFIIGRLTSSQQDKGAALFGGLWFNLILLVIMMFVLPGASYLFLTPVLVGVVILMIMKQVSNKSLLLALLAIVIIMYVPVVYNIYIALTIGALGVVLLLVTLALSTVIPVINYLNQKN